MESVCGRRIGWLKHLEKTTKISLGDDSVRAILKEEKFSFQRPKHTMRGKREEVAYERAEAELLNMNKAIRKNTAEAMIFHDEVEIHKLLALARMWSPVGK